MQALYSYHLAEESLKSVAKNSLEQQFVPDPAKDDFADSPLFALKRKKAGTLYSEQVDKRTGSVPEDVDEEISTAVEEAITDFKESLDHEKKLIRKRMMTDIDDTYSLYLKLLLLPVEFAHIEKLEKEKKEKAYIFKETAWKFHFQNNPVIKALRNFEPFIKEIENRKISWSKDIDLIKTWFKDIVQKNETIDKYQQEENPNIEGHLNAVIYLMKKVVFKNEAITDYLSSIDLRWHENRPVLSSLVVKTLQSFASNGDSEFELKSISKNESDDLDFFVKLFDECLKRDTELDEIVAKKTKNWDISRVALLDRIILKMAIVEMMIFPSIPVKVTINEFIEISKLYSTPKSKQFVNGILDVLANELTSDGVIKKSGRGLIDNK